MENHKGHVIYDRGIPDNIAYAELFALHKKFVINAANQYRYNKRIFFLPAWKEIYKTDGERKMTFDQALRFGDDIRKIYEDLGYRIIDVPMEPPNKRAEFIQNAISGKE
jgi:predicted ATPase